MTSKAKLPIARTTRPLMTQTTPNSEHPFAMSDSMGVLRTFANFSSDPCRYNGAIHEPRESPKQMTSLKR